MNRFVSPVLRYALPLAIVVTPLLYAYHSGFSFPNDSAVTSHKIENPKALENFFNALRSLKSRKPVQPVRIMHFGDSHVAADVLTREIRERFQQQFGDAGPGFIVPRNPMATRRRGVDSGATEGWVIEGIGGRYSHDGIYGPAGINLATSKPGERAWVETRSTHFEVYFVRQPGGGRIDIGLDGISAFNKPIKLSSRFTEVDSLTVDATSDKDHRLEVRTVGWGQVRLLGIVAERITGGISYDVLGINGARANRILSWNQTALATAIKARKPDLIILGYGTNELTDKEWTPARYQLELGEILQLFHEAAPQASLLVWGPPDRTDLPLEGKLVSLIGVERRSALANGSGFWSAYDGMGGPNSMSRWVRYGLGMPDRVHLTTSGYSRLAALFYADVKRALAER